MLTTHPHGTEPGSEDNQEPAVVDDVDLAILEALYHNAMLTSIDLAELLGIDRSTATRRLNQLIKSGAIRGMHARIDPRVIKLSITTYVLLKIGNLLQDPIGRIEQWLESHPNVVEWSRVPGDWDLLIKVITPTEEHYKEFHDQLLREVGIEKINTIKILGPTNGKALPIKVPHFPGRKELTPELKELKQYVQARGNSRTPPRSRSKKKT